MGQGLTTFRVKRIEDRLDALESNPGGGLVEGDIDTIAELNAILTDATLIDTDDSRLSDARTPVGHTHVASDITDILAEIESHSAVAANTAKVSALPTAYMGSPMMMKPAVNEHVGNILTGTLTTQASAANRIDIAPYIAGYAFSIDQIGMSVSTASAGSACGLIFDADANGRPTTLLAQGADIDTGSTGTTLGSVSFSFTAGRLYYIGVWTSAGCTLRCAQTYAAIPLTWTSAATPARESVLRITEAYGGTASAWTYAASQHTGANAPFVLMRVSA